MIYLIKKFSLKAVCIFLLCFSFASPTLAAVSAIIFDCDGVLVDTEYLKFEAWRDALSKKGITFSLENYLPLVGHSSERIASEIEKNKNTKFDKKVLIQEKNTIYKARQTQGVPSIPNAVTFLKHLLANKSHYSIKVGLASSASHREINRNLESIGVNPKNFDAIASGDDDLKHIVDPQGTNKPKPYIYQEIAKTLKVNPRDCLVFEDTNAGIEAATSAGMHALAVPNQYTKNQDFKKSVEIISFEHFTIQKLKDRYLLPSKTAIAEKTEFFTLEQEKYFVEHPHVYAYFSQLYTGKKKTPETIAKEYNLSPKVSHQYLKALSDIGVIKIPENNNLSAPIQFLVKGVSAFSVYGPLSIKFTDDMFKQHYQKSMLLRNDILQDHSKESTVFITSAGFWLTSAEYAQYQEELEKLNEKYISISKANLAKKAPNSARVSVMLNAIPNWEPELFSNIKQNF